MKYDLVVVLGGEIEYTDNIWHSKEPDMLRVIAASYLFVGDKATFILASGGYGMCKSEPIGTVISRELKDRNVSRYRIVTDTLSNNTYEQLEVIKKNMPSHWKVAIISNEWHLPRVNYFAQRLKLKVDLLSAESILFDYDYDLWHPIIEDIRKDKKTQKRIKTEKQKVTEFEKSPRR